MIDVFSTDEYLSPIIPKLDNYDLISVDIFDTLLFRACYSPSDVFLSVGEKLCLEGFDYPKEAYHALRMAAEGRAVRKKQGLAVSQEIVFPDIFDEMPFDSGLKQRMMDLEMECEREVLYLNPHMDHFIRRCKALGKTVVLTSDMYYTSAQLLAFLEDAGFDTGLISGCFVSCDYGCRKVGGKLFDVVLEKHPVPGERVLHIGDNQAADVGGAECAGLHGLYYGVTRREFAHPFDVEHKVYKSRLGAICSLRSLACASSPYEPESTEAFFYKLGASIIGPVYTMFAEWIVDLALRKGTKVIIPFTREGELMSIVINEAIKQRGVDIICHPFSISRRVALAAGVYEDNIDRKIDYVIFNGNCTLRELFIIFGQNIDTAPFASLASISTSQARQENKMDDVTLFLKDNCRQSILTYAAQQRQQLLNKLRAETGGQRTLTADIGLRASTAVFLDEILRRELPGTVFSHALLMGADKRNVENILNGTHVYGCLGIAGENSDIITRFMHALPLLEVLTCSTFGTLIRYSENGESVLDHHVVDDVQVKKVKRCWDGVDSFLKYFYHFRAGNPRLSGQVLTERESFLNIFMRLFEMPNIVEAQNIGNLYLIESMVETGPVKLCGVTLSDKATDSEIEDLISSVAYSNSHWPYAVVVKARPDFFLRKYVYKTTSVSFARTMFNIVVDMKTHKCKRVAIYALSEFAPEFLSVARAMGIPVYCFVDSNKGLHGTVVSGLTVRSFESVADEIDAFVITSYYHSDEIWTLIEKYYGAGRRVPRIYSVSPKKRG